MQTLEHINKNWQKTKTVKFCKMKNSIFSWSGHMQCISEQCFTCLLNVIHEKNFTKHSHKPRAFLYQTRLPK